MEKATKASLVVICICASIFLIPLTFGIRDHRRKNECHNKIENDGIITLGYITHYRRLPNTRQLEGHIEYSDGDKKYETETPTMREKYTRAMPVYVKYSASDPECVSVLMDSMVIIGNEKFQYYNKRFFGWKCKIEKLNNPTIEK